MITIQDGIPLQMILNHRYPTTDQARRNDRFDGTKWAGKSHFSKILVGLYPCLLVTTTLRIGR